MKKVLFAFCVIAFATACNSEGSKTDSGDTAKAATADTTAKMDTSAKKMDTSAAKMDTSAKKDTTKK
ncbi:hypothetical protein EDB95_4348 [Dinghuibacter silviterrae]|uniref:Pentapeptide MXKDX repeat protein n=2 Tax=Dinghuibacter silviterrae TaxID=1539049 RepID=A0A4R8DGD8_9BACT|nr:hypothetical protein EDB95_4348 [Dinghuibacter silviterrae]